MQKNFSMTRGDSSAYVLTFTQNNGLPFNITGWSITFTLKTSYDLPDSQKTFQKIVTVHTDPTHGISTLALIPSDTQLLPSRIYDYDIVVADASSNIYTVLKGKFDLQYDVTWGTAGTIP